MELKQVKSRLQQSPFGELLTDGMSCSEPILTLGETGLIDNFFAYLVSRHTRAASGPLARMALDAEHGNLLSLVSAEEQPFSVSPTSTITLVSPSYTTEDYAAYALRYAKVRDFAFKQDCSAEEKETLSVYLSSLKVVTSSTLFPFYEEMAPSFFAWAAHELADSGMGT